MLETILLIFDKLAGPVLTAVVVAPSIRWWSEKQKKKEYSKRLAAFGGKRVVVKKSGEEIGFSQISVLEAELLNSALKTKSDCLDFSETEARRLLQSIVSGLGERTDKILDRLEEDESGNFYINL